MSHRTLLSLLVVIALATAVDSAERKPGGPAWTQFRGPNRENISPDTGLLKEWPKDGPPLAWKATGLGKGYSSVSVAEGKAFTMGERASKDNPKEKKVYLIALDALNGTELWAAEVGKPSHGGPRCTPTYDDGLVYALSAGDAKGGGDLLCVEAANGKERWRKNLPNDFGGRMQTNWGYSESPLIDGDKLVCTPGGTDATLVALNKKTGETIWKAKVPEGDAAAYCSMVVADVGGIRMYVQLLERSLVGVAAKDGKVLWRYPKIANGTANIPTPVVKDDLIFTSTGYGKGSALLRLAPGSDGVRVEEVYFLKGDVMQNHHGGMVRIGDHIYAGHGHNGGQPTCLEMKTGKIVWRDERDIRTFRSASLTCAEGHLYFRSENATMELIEAKPDGYKQKSSFKLPDPKGPSWPHPVVIGGKLYLRDQETLYCYDVKQK